MADFTNSIVALVRDEKQKYGDASKTVREAIKKARKNYAGVFTQPYTSTGYKKVFFPLTRWECDTLTSKIFVDDKAITVLPENEPSVRSAFIAEKVLKHQVRETRFPMQFRNSLYDLSIDGTTVWTVFWNFKRELVEKKGLSERLKKMVGKGSKPKVNVLVDQVGYQQIDLLNVWCDPTVDSLQDSPSVIFKNIVSLEDVKRNKLYKNREAVNGFTTTPMNNEDASSTMKYGIGKSEVQYEQPMVAVYERWGLVPASYITGKKKDGDTMVPGVITVADLENDEPVVLRVAKNPFAHGMKPFVECWYQKKKGRWYGEAPGTKLIDMQWMLNKVGNRQIQNEDLLHNGMFLKKKGSGVSTKSIVSRAGAVIEVDDMGDLQQLQVRDISQLANGTINRIYDMVERINGTNQIAVGSAADRSATTSLIKDRNADTRFAAVRGNINDFLIRFFKQWNALNRQYLDAKFVLRVTGEDTELEEIDAALGIPEEMREKLPRFRFIDVAPKDIRGDYDLEVDIDQSVPRNKGEHAQRILNAIQIGRQLGLRRDYEKLFDAHLDSIGLTGEKFKSRLGAVEPVAGPQGGGGGPETRLPFDVQEFVSANQEAEQSGVREPVPVPGQINQ